MKTNYTLKTGAILGVALLLCLSLIDSNRMGYRSSAQSSTPVRSPTAVAPFDQAKSIEMLKHQIKGRENVPAEKVFKNIQTLKGVPAARVLRIMELGYSRALGVTCTHCHVPGKWEAEENLKKQVARDMMKMVENINSQQLKNIKNIGDRATINCSTCHRGSVKPSL